MRPAYQPIQLDAAFGFQRAAVHAVRTALATTHGDDFAAAFIAEHRQEILRAARTRLCGSSEAAVKADADRLASAYRGV
jgi:hypothetical protein